MAAMCTFSIGFYLLTLNDFSRKLFIKKKLCTFPFLELFRNVSRYFGGQALNLYYCPFISACITVVFRKTQMQNIKIQQRK